jgi:predicted transcriptional regulator
VWDKQRVTVRYVYEELRRQWRIAYTPVMSVLRNPAAKGLPEQDKSKQATSTRPPMATSTSPRPFSRR